MKTWKNASNSDLKLFDQISILLHSNSHLIDFMFDQHCPKLRVPVEDLLRQTQGMCPSDQVLVKLSIDFWCGQGGCLVNELFDYKDFIFPKLVQALYDF